MPNNKQASNLEIAIQFTHDPKYETDLVYCRNLDLFYVWCGYYYKQVDPKEMMEQTLIDYLVVNFKEISWTHSKILDVFRLIKSRCLRKINDVDMEHIAFRDKYFNTDIMKPVTTSKEFVVTHKLDFNYPGKEKYNIEVFESYLNSSLVMQDNHDEPDKDLINFTQTMFGYFLLNTITAEKSFFLTGVGANGKSVMLNIIRHMIGDEFVSAMTLQSLTTDKFKSHNLIGKKINICGEEESKYLDASKFKAMVSGDLIDAERKFGDSFEFKPNVKFLFSTNNIPTFKGIDYALKRRLVLIPFNRKFSEQECDRKLLNKLKKEMPGIIKWSIDGARKLLLNDLTFKLAQSQVDKMHELEAEISSVIAFINENYYIDKTCTISLSDLYNKYGEWCYFQRRKPVNMNRFARETGAYFPTAKAGKAGKHFKYINPPKNTNQIPFGN